MNEVYYNYIHQMNEQMLQSVALERQLQALRPKRTGLRERLLLSLSDALLDLSLRIRPEEIRPAIQIRIMDDCSESLANLT